MSEKNNTLMLSKAITAHNETLTVLEFREPTGKDVRELGYPYQVSNDESIKLSASITAKYISRLANIPMSSVDEMSPSDMGLAGALVIGFFV